MIVQRSRAALVNVKNKLSSNAAVGCNSLRGQKGKCDHSMKIRGATIGPIEDGSATTGFPPTPSRRANPLVMPNAWDAGSAKLFVLLGFAAIATTVPASPPRSVDPTACVRRGRGFGAHSGARRGHAATGERRSRGLLRRRPRRGGGDDHGGRGGRRGRRGRSRTSARHERPIHDIGLATDRVAAAAEAARASGLVLTARAENLIHGIRDLDDTIRRLQAYQEAGADVLYGRGCSPSRTSAAVVSSVDGR